MKKLKLLLLLPFIAAGNALQAQQQNETEEQFKAFIHEQGQQLITAYKEEDYAKGIDICHTVMTRAEELPADLKKDYGWQKNNYAYHLTRFLCLQGKEREALEAFKIAYDNGKSGLEYETFSKDTALKLLHGNKEFEAIAQKIKEASDYLYILQQAPAYTRSTRPDTLPHFTYAHPNDPNLVRVRQYFSLDSVAGAGDEISKIKNILTYIHNTIRHDGQHSNPAGGMNAINMAEACKDGSRGLNCRGLATVLNECYLSLGIPSRVVTCMPKTFISDCHVINAVYSATLDKWLWIDPTHNAWVMDEAGNLLSIQEVRERLRDGHPLVLNEEANWNNQQKTKADHYLYNYMAKNLYYLNCWIRYEFNTESNGHGTQLYVNLMPTGFDTTVENPNNLRVNDDTWFWQSPYTDRNLIGTWLQPVPGMPNLAQGFTLEQSGKASSVHMATLVYETWQKQGNLLILNGKSIGNHQTLSFADTLAIERLTADSLHLRKGQLLLKYARQTVPMARLTPAKKVLQVSGTLTIGHEVRTFLPTGSTTAYWIVDRTGQLLQAYDELTSGIKNGKPVHAELEVIDMGQSDDGFARDYAGVYHVTKIKKLEATPK